jgi:hypothetical protein
MGACCTQRDVSRQKSDLFNKNVFGLEIKDFDSIFPYELLNEDEVKNQKGETPIKFTKQGLM